MSLSKSKKGWGVIPTGKRKDVRLVHPWNAPGAIVCSAVLEKSAVARAVHPLKAEAPILVIVAGIDMLVRVVLPCRKSAGRVVIAVKDKLRLVRVGDITPVRGSLNELELRDVTV